MPKNTGIVLSQIVLIYTPTDLKNITSAMSCFYNLLNVFFKRFFPSISSTPTPEINSKTEDQIEDYTLVTLSETSKC